VFENQLRHHRTQQPQLIVAARGEGNKVVRGLRNPRLLNQLGNAATLAFACCRFDQDIAPRRPHRFDMLAHGRQFVDPTDEALKAQI